MKKMKMAFVDLSNFKDWPMGGMLSYELTILPYIAKHYDVELWGVSVDGVAPEPVMLNNRAYEVNVICDVKTSHRLIPNFFRPYFAFSKRKNDFLGRRYDVVYAHTSSALVAISKFGFDGCLAFHQHGLSYLNTTDPKGRMQKGMNTLAQKKADIVFVVSGEEDVRLHAERMKNRTNANYVQMRSPVELSLFINSSTDQMVGRKEKLRFICTGRIDAWKNQSLLVDSFKTYLEATNRDDELFIVGDGEARKSVELKSKNNGLERNVYFTGRLSHGQTVKELMSSDVFLFPSKGEGMPLSVLEAFAAGLPVVCFDVEGLRNIVLDNSNGVVVHSLDADSFAHGIQQAVNNISRLSTGAFETSSKYNAEIVAGDICTAIDSALNEADSIPSEK